MVHAQSYANREDIGNRASGSVRLDEQWRLIPLQVGDSQDHMRLTDALVRSAQGRRPTVWWHATETPTVLVGRGVGLRHPCGSSAIRVIHRPTGGGAVLAGPGVVGLDIALPANHRLLTGDIVRDYRWLGEIWSDALSRLGLDATLVSIDDCRRQATQDELNADLQLVCFGTFSPFEVTVEGRKVVGLSQVRRRGGVLFSSAVHVNADPGGIVEILPITKRRRNALREALSRRAASLESQAHVTIAAAELMEVFRHSLSDRIGVRLRKGTWGRRELQRFAESESSEGSRLRI